MIQGTERTLGGPTGEAAKGLRYPLAGSVARAARRLMGRRGPEQHEQDGTAK
jgi:hypothetical protein